MTLNRRQFIKTGTVCSTAVAALGATPFVARGRVIGASDTIGVGFIGVGGGYMVTPALIVFGREDRMMPTSAGRLLMQQMQHARLELVDGAGHMVMLEQPDGVAELMSAFLRSVPYQPGE